MKTKVKRALSGLLACAVIAAAIPFAAFAAQDGIELSTAEAFWGFAAEVNGGNNYEGKTVTLTVDLDLGGEQSPWTPIGTAEAPFAGVFDGGYHVISGLSVPSGDSVGLFGRVEGGTVKNLVAEGSVTGGSAVGGVIGTLKNGRAENCGSRVAVSGQSGVGGVVGAPEGGCTVSGCFHTGSVTGSTGYVGGVVGQGANGCSVSDCYNAGQVTGPATVGGVLGGHKAYSTALSDSYNVGTVTGSSDNNIGPVAGKTRGSVTNCYYLANSANYNSNGYGTEFADALSADRLSDAFADASPFPVLKWEEKISAGEPVSSGFTEKTQRSGELAGLIRAAVSSAKAHSAADAGSLLGSSGFLGGASSTETDWMALAMARFGYFDRQGEYRQMIDDGDGYQSYLAALKSYIEKTYAAQNGILHSAKATEWHRAVLAVTALGGDPTAFGSYHGSPIDLIADGSYNCVLNGGPGKQGINGWIFGLIAMDTGMFAVLEQAKYSRETFITEILKAQLSDGADGNEYGGWVLGGYGTASDIDITAMAVQALAPYYNDGTVYTYVNTVSKVKRSVTVRQCVDEALAVLSARMDQNGGFSSWGSKNVEGIAQVLVALCSLGIDPAADARFVTSGGKTLLDGLLQFRLADGGFSHVLGGEWNYMANDQATYALIAYWRFENGMRTLYDMRDDFSADASAAIAEASAAIEALPDPSAGNYKEKIKEALGVFQAVPAGERRYVGNYSSLAAALELIGGEDKLDTPDPYAVSIRVTKQPDKLQYLAGDRFDPAGMEVTAVFSDKTEQAVSGYRWAPASELTPEDHTVTVFYGVLKTSLSISVEEKMPWEGSGSKEDPYRIDTPEKLTALAEHVNGGEDFAGKYAVLTANLDLSGTAWTPIGRTQRLAFAGVFDGQGFCIDNLTSEAGGLFGYAADSAVIRNVGVASGEIGKQDGYGNFLGGVVGWSDGADVINCWNGADLFGSWSGGVVGTVRGGESRISGCFNRGNITGPESASRLGGIVGHLASGVSVSIEDCYNTGAVCAGSAVGGIVGGMQDGPHSLRRCYHAGQVASVSQNENSNREIGAVVGTSTARDNTLSDCYYLSGSCSEGGVGGASQIEDNTTALDGGKMTDGSLGALLGSAFKEDPYGLENNGYPLLFWQQTPDADAVDQVIALIAAIGEVTLEREEAVSAAREAYDALEDEALQSLVSDYDRLVRAEEILQELKNKPAPSEPTKPDTPTEPDLPSVSDSPAGQDRPAAPGGTPSPKTGGASTLPLLALLLLAGGTAAGSLTEKGRKKR